MASNKPKVSLLVLNWNGKRYIDSFFNSIDKQTYGTDNIEVLFIDNDSHDDSVEYFLSKKIPYARLIQTGANHGYAGGNNFGFKQAKGEYIVVCNNDLELTPTWLEELIKAARKTNADVTVPKLVYGNEHTINNAGSNIFAHQDWPIIERGIGQPDNNPEFNKPAEVTAFCGASPMFKKSFLHDVGIFDKTFFLYWEDGDLSWRGQKAGKKFHYAPDAIAYHFASGSTGGEQSPTFIYFVSRNRLLILLKHASPLVIFKGFAKVSRDHILYKMRDLFNAIKQGSGRKKAANNLWLGVRIVFGAILLSPIMLGKRWKILKEERI